MCNCLITALPYKVSLQRWTKLYPTFQLVSQQYTLRFSHFALPYFINALGNIYGYSKRFRKLHWSTAVCCLRPYCRFALIYTAKYIYIYIYTLVNHIRRKEIRNQKQVCFLSLFSCVTDNIKWNRKQKATQSEQSANQPLIRPTKNVPFKWRSSTEFYQNNRNYLLLRSFADSRNLNTPLVDRQFYNWTMLFPFIGFIRRPCFLDFANIRESKTSMPLSKLLNIDIT